MRVAFSVPPMRMVLLGLALSAAGGLGLVALASAHDSAGPGARHVMARTAAPSAGWPMLGGPMMDHLLDEVQATPEQRTQLRQIAEAARKDLAAQHEGADAERAQWASLFAQPVVDAGAAEALRQKMLARHDAASRRMTQAALDSSKVLSVAQRQQLAERMKQRAESGRGQPGEGGHGGHRGMLPRG